MALLLSSRLRPILLAITLTLGVFCAASESRAARERASASAFGWRATAAHAAEQMIGAPYVRGGRTPAGFDCSGLVAYSYARVGLTGLPRTAAGLRAHATPIGVDQLRAGDLLFFDFGGPRVSHVAIYLGDGRFVHARRPGVPVRRDSLDDPYWARELDRAGRLER